MPNGFMGGMAQRPVGMANPQQTQVMPQIQGRQRGAVKGGHQAAVQSRLMNQPVSAARPSPRQATQPRMRGGGSRFGMRAAQRFGTAPGRPPPDGFGGRTTAMQPQARQAPPRMARQQARGFGARQRFR